MRDANGQKLLMSGKISFHCNGNALALAGAASALLTMAGAAPFAAISHRVRVLSGRRHTMS